LFVSKEIAGVGDIFTAVILPIHRSGKKTVWSAPPQNSTPIVSVKSIVDCGKGRGEFDGFGEYNIN